MEVIPGAGMVSDVNGTQHNMAAAQSSADFRAVFMSETMEV